jgi:C1A family cysteine protease
MDEFVEQLKLKEIPSRSSSNSLLQPSIDVSATPAEWDWVAQGAVSSIKDQGKCRFV